MKISEIVKTSATMIAREDVVEYLKSSKNDNVEKSTLETVDLLTRLTNLVVSELAEGFIRMKKTVKVDGLSKVDFKSLGIEPLDIIAVFDANGNKLDFTLSPYGLTATYGLIHSVEYSYFPENYGLTDTVGVFEKKVTLGTLSYGVLAEYCLTEGRFDEAVMWNERYVNAIDSLLKPKNGRIKGRAFL